MCIMKRHSWQDWYKLDLYSISLMILIRKYLIILPKLLPRSLYINEAAYPLRVIEGRAGANIGDCDGTECGGELCRNSGVCVVQENSPGYHCDCPDTYTREHCQVIQHILWLFINCLIIH